MKQVYIATYLALALGLSACSPKLADVAPMETAEAPAPVVANKALDASACASDGIGGTGCPVID